MIKLNIFSFFSGHYLIFNIVRLDLPSMRNCSGTDYLQIQVWYWLLSSTGVVLITFRCRCGTDYLQIQVWYGILYWQPSDTGEVRCWHPSDTGVVRYWQPSDTGEVRCWQPSDTGVVRTFFRYRCGTSYRQLQVWYWLISGTGVVLNTFRYMCGTVRTTFRSSDTGEVLNTFSYGLDTDFYRIPVWCWLPSGIEVRYLLLSDTGVVLIAIADKGVVLITCRCRSGLYRLTFDTDVVLMISLDI